MLVTAFSPFPTMFSKDFFLRVVKSRDCVVKSCLTQNMFIIPHILSSPKQALVCMCLNYKYFENTVGKGEIAHYGQLLLFPQCFLSFWRTFCHFHQIQNCLQTLSVYETQTPYLTTITLQLNLETVNSGLSLQRPVQIS